MRKSTFAKLLVFVLVLVVAVPSMGIFAQDDPATVVDVINGSDQHATLATALTLADPTAAEALTGEGPLTVFAPTDAAFEELPELVFNAALEDTALLTNILTYHVVPSQIMAGDIAEGCTDVETVNGATLEVCKDGETVTVNSATVTAADLTAGNGVVHVIDGLVIPPVELPEVDPAAAEGEIVTAGSSTVGPLSVAIASQWEEEGATTVPTIDIIGSGAGFERFCVNAETDISNASRPIKDSEVESCQENGRNPIEFRVGTDAVAVTVSNDFVTDLSLEQLAQIFSGEVTNWNEVDSSYPDLPITLYIPGTDSGTFDFFVEVVLEEDEEAALAGNPQMSENDDVLVEGIAGDEGAIGYFGYAYYQQNQDILNIISIDGITANASTVDAFTYPLARPLFIYSDANIMAEKPQVAAFINYYLTNVNDVIGEVGYFPASADALNLARLKWQIATAQ